MLRPTLSSNKHCQRHKGPKSCREYFDSTSPQPDPSKPTQKWFKTCRFWSIRLTQFHRKHCQRQNGPEGEFISQVITQILIKQFRNFDKALTSKSEPNISILTKLKLKILGSESRPRFDFTTSTKHQKQKLNKDQLQNLSWTSATKSWPNLVLKVWIKL